MAVSAGINELKTAFNGKVIKALKSGAWKKASRLIFDNLAKKLGKKSATFLLKKAVGAVLPSSLAGMLIWNATKCTLKLISQINMKKIGAILLIFIISLLSALIYPLIITLFNFLSGTITLKDFVSDYFYGYIASFLIIFVTLLYNWFKSDK